MEPVLTINGLGFRPGLTYDPNGWKPGDPIFTPGLKPPTGGFTPSVPSTPIITKQKGNGWNKVGMVGNLLVNLGSSAANVIAALKGNQPVFVQNPQTGEQIDVRAELKKQAEEQGKTNEQMLQMLQMAIMQNQQQQKPKDNTVLYVGVGVGVVAISALAYYFVNKNKKKSNNKR